MTSTPQSAQVHLAITGDQQAWRELIKQYEGLLRSIAWSFRLGKADADDATQATWALLVQHLGQLRDPEKVGGWLACTMRRECIALTNRRRREVLLAEADHNQPADPAGDPDRGVLTGERSALLRAAMDRLPTRQRQVLEALSPDPAPSYLVISERLSIAVGTIGPTRAKALRRMHELLTPHRESLNIAS
jgi:RNA polymerase sigma factor (sigma-70 family)